MNRVSVIVRFLSIILLLVFTHSCFGAMDAKVQVPPMGWNSWNHYGCAGLNAGVIKQTAAAMVSSGMKDAGYSYINLDDCWMATSRDANGALIPDPVKFPDGMPTLVDYVHNLGLKFGLYEDAGTSTCQGRPGSYGHYDQDAATFATWGVDYIKVDWCSTQGMNPITQYTQFADALHAANPGIVLSICEWGVEQPWAWASAIANLWRTTPDIRDNWSSLLNNLEADSALASYAKPGAWNDPDMLEVGNGGMSDSEYRVQFAGWSMLAAPLIAGNDLTAMSAGTIATLTSSEVIAVDQDALGRQGILLWDNGAGQQAWVRQVTNGTVVALMNFAPEATTVSFDFGDIGIGPNVPLAIRDLWNKTDLGTWNGSFSATVASHDVRMIKIPVQAALPRPMIYEADAAANLLSGQAAIGECSACLDGYYVFGLGGWPQNTIAIRQIVADAAAKYYLSVYANLSGSSYYTYAVNGGGTSTMEISGTSPAFPSTSGAVIELNSGSNTIVFGSPLSSTANLDHISIMPKAGMAPSFDIVFPVSGVVVGSPGQSGSTTLSFVALNGFSGTVAIQCSVPNSMTGATCQGSTVALSAEGPATATLSIQTTGSQLARSRATQRSEHATAGPERNSFQALLALATALPLVLVRRLRQQIKRMRAQIYLAGAVAVPLLISGCGRSVQGSASATAPGTYSISVTAASGTIAKSTIVQVTVE
jgi:alpha-galactosidase